MEITHIPYKEFSPNEWSGGLTTELFIFPRTASYANRDFDFRLSTATVEVKESSFTPLPGVSRTLLVMDGEMILEHKDHHATTLHPTEVDRFDGGWETSSFGKCKDFNLMTRGFTSGELQMLEVPHLQEEVVDLKKSDNWLFLFLYKGGVDVRLAGEKRTLQSGDLLAIFEPTFGSVEVFGNETSELVLCSMKS